MCSRRPALAGLWFGAIMMGLGEQVLQRARCGWPAIELQAAAWTNTIQVRVSSKASDHPWKPFGGTPVHDTDLEVCVHMNCKGYCLIYQYSRWQTECGPSQADLGFDEIVIYIPQDAYVNMVETPSTQLQTAGELQSEALSEAAICSIFGWLRTEGHASHEKDIFTHEWFLPDNDSDSSPEKDEDSDGEWDEAHKVEKWLSDSLGTAFFRYFFLILALVDFSLQVDVVIGGKRWLFTDEHGNVEIWTAGCHDLQPGECCMKPPGLIIDPGFVLFTGLQDLDVAFLWKMRLLSPPGEWPVQAHEACSGDSFRSQVGGPTWTYKWGASDPSNAKDPNPRAAGANYLRLPPKLPPSATEVDWLGMEGLEGFVYDKGKWIADQQYASIIVGPGGSNPLPKRKEVKCPGTQISKNRSVFRGGTFYASPAKRGRYADWVCTNGTNFTNAGLGGLKYTDKAGRVLDLDFTAT
ncbi:MAG: hypothetical protein Q9218_005535 [Villophora microphyllina]